MRFFYPEFLWLLLAIPLLAFLRGRKGRTAALEYSSGELVRSVARERPARAGRWLTMLRFGALALAILALARPQFGRGTTEIEASGIDMVLALDVSRSMEARDFRLGGQAVSRLDVAKSVVAKFIEGRPNDRIALVVFAGRPYLISPLTLDHDWLLQNLERVHLGLIEDGTAIGSGIAASVNRLRDQPSKSKIVILLTDGVNNAGKVSPEIAADAARTLGIKVYTIGAGSASGTVMVTVKDQFGNEQKVPAKVEIDEETLRKVANITDAEFYRATDTGSLRRIYSKIDQLEKTTVKLKKFENYRELFDWALVPCLMILGMEMVLSQTRYRRLP